MVLARGPGDGEKGKERKAALGSRSVLRALFTLFSAALLVRVVGMVNQMGVSAQFGAGEAMDAYFVASALPLLLCQLVGSALEAAIIPVYCRLRYRARRDEMSRWFSTLVNVLLGGALILILVLITLRQPVTMLAAPGLDEERLRQAVVLVPWLYLLLPINLLISLLVALLNAEGQFAWSAYTGLLVPLISLLLIMGEARTWGIFVLCIGGFCGTCGQLVVVGIKVMRLGIYYRPIIDLKNTEVRLVCRTAWPVLVGALLTQGGPLVDQIFASTLPVGGISALNYALKLVSVFIGVIVVSLGRVALPHLAHQAARGNAGKQIFKETLHGYLWCVGIGTGVLSIVLLRLIYLLVQILFQHGAFSAHDAQATALIFTGFLPGLMPIALNFLLTRAFNALGETRIPMYMALVTVLLNAFFDALFAHFWSGLGIALATSVVSWCVCLLLLLLLSRRVGSFPLWRIPPGIEMLVRRWFLSRNRMYSWIQTGGFGLGWRGHLRRVGLYLGLTAVVLTLGVVAIVHDAPTALRMSFGAFFLLCFLRYPFMLLLAWASVNVCIGSNVPGFNGNNLDLVLILPSLGLLLLFQEKKHFRRMPGLVWLALYLLWVLLGIQLSPLSTQAFLTLWVSMLASLGVGVLTLGLVSTQARLNRLVDVLLGTALLIALYGGYGFVTHQYGAVDEVTSLFRISSIFTQATTCALYLSLVLPLAFYRCFCTQGARRLLSMTLTVCLLCALLLTFTRSAYIGVLGSFVLMVLCVPDYRVRLPISGALCLLGGVIGYLAWYLHLPVFARFFNGDLGTLNGRLYLWQALLNNFQATRWLGGGLQSSDQLLFYLHVGNRGRGVIGTAPHSLFLGTLFDHGIIGLLLLCGGFSAVGWNIFRGLRRSRGERRVLYGAALACLWTMLLQSLGSRDLWIQAIGAPFWIMVALPFACYWTGKEKGRCSSQRWMAPRAALSSSMPGALPLCQRDVYGEGEV